MRLALAVAVSLLIGLVVAALVVRSGRDNARTRADAAIRSDVATDANTVRTELVDQRTAAATTGGRVYAAADVARAPISPDAAVNARDSGTATLDDEARPVSIVVPVYRGGAEPANTASRRQTIVAYRVVPVQLTSTLSKLRPSSGGITVSGPDRLVAASPRAAPAGARSFAVDLQMRSAPGWSVEVWRPNPGVPGTSWLWAALLLALFGGFGGVMTWLLLRVARSEQQVHLLELDRAVVTGLAPMMQRSLDIGDVIPEVSVHLVDRLELAGLSLSTRGEFGERAVFGWGTPPDTSVAPSPVRPERLETGETFAVALARGGRVFGMLRVVAGPPLGPYQLASLSTVGELLGSTLANAEAFARQQELLARLNAVDELKTVFLATASHELRTPVAAIVGFSSLLLEQWDTLPTERSKPLVERVMVNGRRLDALIEQLLDFSRLERGLPTIGDETIELGAGVARILAEQTEIAAKHTLELVIATEDAVVRGSSTALERIVINLVGNAAKYSPAGTRITVTVRVDADEAVLIVDDEGPGVALADRERVFSRFYRGKGDAVTRTRGAGVGLAIVAEYAAAMTARVAVEDAPSGGARFVVAFPVIELRAPVDSDADADADADVDEGRMDVAFS